MQVAEARIVGRFGDNGAMRAHPDPCGVRGRTTTAMRRGVARLALAVMLFAIAGCANDSAFTTPHPATGDFAGPVDIGEGRHLIPRMPRPGWPDHRPRIRLPRLFRPVKPDRRRRTGGWSRCARLPGPTACVLTIGRAPCATPNRPALRNAVRPSPCRGPRKTLSVTCTRYSPPPMSRDPTFLSRTPLVACSAGSTPRPIPIRCARCCSSTRSPSRYPR